MFRAAYEAAGKREVLPPPADLPSAEYAAVVDQYGNPVTPHQAKPPMAWNDRPDWRPRKRPPSKSEPGRYVNAVRAVNELIDKKHPKPLPPDLPMEKGRAGNEARLPALTDWLASGGTTLGFCRKTGVSYASLNGWLRENPEAREKVSEARKRGYDALAEEALDIASTPMMQDETYTEYDADGNITRRQVARKDAVYARKLAFQARMELLKRWDPERYGEKPAAGDTASLTARLLAARVRVRKMRFS